jgi:hypothetical protein
MFIFVAVAVLKMASQAVYIRHPDLINKEEKLRRNTEYGEG